MNLNVSKKRISSIALISFTDIIFLLLIFILISSSFITHSGVKVSLPRSSSQQNEYNKNISLTLTNNDEIFINEEKVSWDNVTSSLRAKLIDNPEQVIVVRADEDIQLKKIIKLLDLAKLSGSNKFFIATEITVDEK